MRTRLFLLEFLLVCLVSPGFAQKPRGAASAPTEVVASLNSFGLRLHRILATQNPQGNLVHSPYSLGTSLAALSCGAQGETLAELRQAMGLPVEANLLSGYEAFNESLGQSCQVSQPNGMSLHIANRLYVQKGYRLESSFRTSVKEVFRCDLEMADFKGSPASERRTINSWVERQTGGAFRQFLTESFPTPETRLLFANALVFRARWYHFESEDTHSAVFNLPGGRTTGVPMMVKTMGNLRAEKRVTHSAVSLDFDGSQFSFLLLVPAQDEPLEKLEASLTAEDLAAYPRMAERVAKLYLPRFNLFHASPSLRETLRTLGLGRLFLANQPDFSRLSNEKGLGFDDMLHHARIKVDEAGVFAAAASASSMAAFGSPPEPELIIKADRPFLFAIQHTKSGACLFLGRVTDPR